MSDLLPAHFENVTASLERQAKGRRTWGHSPERRNFIVKLKTFKRHDEVVANKQHGKVVETVYDTLTVRVKLTSGLVLPYHVRSVEHA